VKSGSNEIFIEFKAGGNSKEFCRSGWSEPEPGHAWAIGQESTLELPRPAEPGIYRMELKLGPFIHKDKLAAQRLSVLVNGTEVGAFEVREVTSLECTVPWSALEAKETAAIRFVHPDAAKPSTVSGVPDHRELALAFEQIRLWRQPEGYVAEDRIGDREILSTEQRGSLSRDQLMMQFESLGENCEFGLAQRRCGAEPLGLLRFASAPLPNLLAGLKHQFAGLGDADQIEVRPSPDQSEYLVIDRRFGFLYHPWVLVGEAKPEDVLKREKTHLPFLRRKMLEDLKEGRKIFVYHGMRPLAEAVALRLLAAIRSYGPGTLLWVELQDEAHPAGSVELIAPGLLKGYIDRFAPGENAHDFSLDSWIDICRNTYRLIHSGHGTGVSGG
jgi:hypothetical protein